MFIYTREKHLTVFSSTSPLPLNPPNALCEQVLQDIVDIIVPNTIDILDDPSPESSKFVAVFAGLSQHIITKNNDCPDTNECRQATKQFSKMKWYKLINLLKKNNYDIRLEENKKIFATTWLGNMYKPIQQCRVDTVHLSSRHCPLVESTLSTCRVDT